MTNEQTPFETVYYIEESNKIHVTELFDISDCEDTSLQTAAERELNQMLEFDIDDWGDADFGGGGGDDDGDQGWDKDFHSDDDLFPPDDDEAELEQERGSFIQSKGVDAETFKDDVVPARRTTKDDGSKAEQNEEDANDDPYFFSDMASKALNMSQEYNEMIFGTFSNMAEEEEEEKQEESNVGDSRHLFSDMAAAEGEESAGGRLEVVGKPNVEIGNDKVGNI